MLPKKFVYQKLVTKVKTIDTKIPNSSRLASKHSTAQTGRVLKNDWGCRQKRYPKTLITSQKLQS